MHHAYTHKPLITGPICNKGVTYQRKSTSIGTKQAATAKGHKNLIPIGST